MHNIILKVELREFSRETRMVNFSLLLAVSFLGNESNGIPHGFLSLLWRSLLSDPNPNAIWTRVNDVCVLERKNYMIN